MVVGLLEAEGIGCVLNSERFSAVNSPVALATGGVSVEVREADLARAADILRAQEQEAQEMTQAPWARSRKASPLGWLAALFLIGLIGVIVWNVYSNLMTLMYSR